MATFFNLNTFKKDTITLDRPGEYIAFFHNISGQFTFNIRSPNIRLDIYGLLTGKKNDVFEIETVQRHEAPSSISNLLIKGVFDDQSKMKYQGLIRIEKTGQKSHAYQKNQNLILSPKTFVDSRPFLEILANDVFCTHGSTTGKINSEELYYIKTRGINDKNARALYINGFIDDILKRVKEFGVQLKDNNYVYE